VKPAWRRLWTELGIPADYAATRRLPVQAEARRLVSAGRHPNGRRIRLAPGAAAAWTRLRAAAARDGIVLVPISGFRSVARQASIIRRKLAAGHSLGHILRFVAAPGCSEHHTGRALDLAGRARRTLDGTFARTAAYRWLQRHAARFGFHLSYPRDNPHGIGYEPWHWSWRPPGRIR
jgi:D-alanyl-D-alanine carboxypeptidase